ncbi:MAG TPA: TIR domain-containing protein [Rhizomicrobium sp.]|jgi:hypothetical protein|nr:TIR domain-containing protein [Rhizomicrobium sp.]
MARKVFFSFHYERDAWRAANVRNCDTISDDDEYGVIDAAEWEEIESGGDTAIKKWIKEQLHHTSVTVVLIGAETASRDWVLYEIRESWKRGNAVLGLRVHGIKDQDRQTDTYGKNPLDKIKFADGTSMSLVCKTYDWCADNGRDNLSDWVETAYQERQDLDQELEEESKKIEVKNTAYTAAVASGPTIISSPAKPWAE